MTDNISEDALIESSDPAASAEYIQKYLEDKEQQLKALPDGASDLDRARINLDIAEAKVGITRGDEAWDLARTALDIFLADECWQEAVEACDVLYQSNQPASLVALAHGVWLAVTYPIDPQLTINMLGYVIDETPPSADGAAVAAITAHYIADIRGKENQRESLMFLTNEMVTNVAKAHSQVEDQEALSAWMEKLRLHDPADFLPKLALVLGALVPADQWWFDRDALRDRIPD
ncbi:MAG: hypothetical protein HKP12_00745 [Gammaproteobacteria bacterium]|nr:hypothetical protein [Gammaproteobacteria bacterium]NNJ95671.1 hypothetical protein [Gammaproteobacteria bacterium]